MNCDIDFIKKAYYNGDNISELNFLRILKTGKNKFLLNKKMFYDKFPLFDYEYYISVNSDLKQNGIDTFEKAIVHFWHHGFFEEREYYPKIQKNDTSNKIIEKMKNYLVSKNNIINQNIANNENNLDVELIDDNVINDDLNSSTGVILQNNISILNNSLNNSNLPINENVIDTDITIEKINEESKLVIHQEKKPIKLLFAGHDFKFINKVIDHFSKNSDYIVKINQWDHHNKHDETQTKKLLLWADIIFCEWCLGNAVWFSIRKKKTQRLFIRLHKIEITTEYINDVNWKRVDKVIFIAPKMFEIMVHKFSVINKRSLLIYNYIDTNNCDKPKIVGHNYNLGLLGYVPLCKRPDLAIELLIKLRKTDNRYKLYIKGKSPAQLNWVLKKPENKEYYDKMYDLIKTNNLDDVVIFEDHGDDVNEWFKKIGYILSTSDIEGSHQSVAEGMASGAIPIMTGDYVKLYGANLLYPAKFCFDDINKCADTIIEYNSLAKICAEEQINVKLFSKNNFDVQKVFSEYDDLFKDNVKNSLSRITYNLQNSCDFVLIYGNLNLNIIDGSIIWLQNLVKMLRTTKINAPNIILLSKLSNITNPIVDSLNVNIVEPSMLSKKVISISDLQEVIPSLDAIFNFKSIILRLDEFNCNFDFDILQKIIIYPLAFKNVEILNKVKYVALQTTFLENKYLMKGLDKKQIMRLTPMVNFTKMIKYDNSKIKFCYSGTFKKDYNVNKIINCFIELNKLYPNQIELKLIVGKVVKEEKYYDETIKLLELCKTLNFVTIYEKITNDETLNVTSDCQVGIGWRKTIMDESDELSTKLLEYLSSGKVILVNRNKINEYLLGSDYPLFCNSQVEFITSCKKIINGDIDIDTISSRNKKLLNCYLLKNVAFYNNMLLLSDKKLLELVDFNYLESTFQKIDYSGDNNKICYLVHNSLPSVMSGYTVRTHKIIKYLIKNDKIVYPVSKLDNHNSDHEDYDGITYYNLMYKSNEKKLINFKKTAYYENYINKLAEFIVKHNIGKIHACSSYVNGIAAYIVSKFLDIPFVWEIRGFWELTANYKKPELFNVYNTEFQHQHYCETYVAKNATIVYTLTERMKENLICRNVDSNKIKTLPNGIDIGNLTQVVEFNDIELEQDYNDKKHIIGYIGSFIGYEGLSDLIKVMQNLQSKYVLYLIGGGVELINLINLVSNLNLDNVKFRDKIGNNLVSYYYKKFSICVIPRVKHILCDMVTPIKPFEAMFMKVPVLVSKLKVTKEYITEKTGFTFEPGNLADLEDKIKMICNSDTNEIVNNAHEWIIKNRQWDTILCCLLDNVNESKVVNINDE